jgi:hypothetical protein
VTIRIQCVDCKQDFPWEGYLCSFWIPGGAENGVRGVHGYHGKGCRGTPALGRHYQHLAHGWLHRQPGQALPQGLGEIAVLIQGPQCVKLLQGPAQSPRRCFTSRSFHYLLTRGSRHLLRVGVSTGMLHVSFIHTRSTLRGKESVGF